MPLRVRFLGTAASRPTVERGVSSLALVREGETFLFDCGEGTQRQMMRYGISFSFDDLFFTHTHADHILGLTGLIRTLQLQARMEPLRLFAPVGSAKVLRQCISLGGDRTTFPVTITELDHNDVVKRDGFHIQAFAVDHHGSASLGFAVIEEERKGRFNPDLARQLGVPEGPLWGRIHRGESITLGDGRVIAPSVLVGEQRRGRRITITGDTRPCQATVDAARDADLLIHEATFADDEAERAQDTGHSTAREAADVAIRAGVRQLALTHISARYSRDAHELEREAKQLFANTLIARDGTEIVIGLTEEPAVPVSEEQA